MTPFGIGADEKEVRGSMDIEDGVSSLSSLYGSEI